ncbi:Protein prenylyltransferase superfamily protein [Striga hermonthica]|uniref:Protein prenylyltransferase superfamily protein n=1 Tax=Striga hermonthica TaxID=68872 RepID=A0A9N7MYF2_STRHE|nr:Protein prenylyltransferase superfamily protein [Striga hermonthica]
MAANDGVLLRSLELRLLRCSLPSENPSRPPSPIQSSPSVASRFPHLHSLLNDVVAFIETGSYVQALSSPQASQALFSDLHLASCESPEHFYTETLPNCISSFLNVNGGDDSLELGYKALLVIAVGVSALLSFAQCNFTGPLDNIPLMLLEELPIRKDERGNLYWIEWEAWAQKELMSVGSHLHAKFSNLQYLIFGKILLMRTRDLLFQGDFSSIDGVRSITWWLARALFLHQKLLDGHSSILFDLLQVFTRECLSHFDTLEKIRDYWCANEDCSTILSVLQLELGILEIYYGRVDASNQHFESAAEMSNYNFFISGALGFRTQHQEEPKALLRLVSETNGGDTSDPVSQDASTAETTKRRQLSEAYGASDVLIAPRFLDGVEHFENIKQDAQCHVTGPSQLKAVHQALILAHCLSIEKKARSDEMQMWELAPYIEAIDSQDTSPFIVRYYCNILRVRWESSRSRTKQRALLMMEKLVEGLYDPSPGVPQRLYYCFAVNMPSIPALRKEYGDLLVSCGLIGEALTTYEDLELWDHLIHCYQLMDKKPAAIDLINRRLLDKPSDPRLWCSLGDITHDDAPYHKALEVSGHRSARAFRSLAKSAYNRADYENSKKLWESAMNLNSMYPDGWFALGAAALKSRDINKALDAFTRSIQLEPENSEAWNNIACIHKVNKRSRESFIAFKEALKLKRNSWQMWENYSDVAADVGNFSQALEALSMVLELTNMKRVNCDLLGRVMSEVEGKNGNSALAEQLGRVLRCAVQGCGGSPELWGLYARWHRVKGDLVMCSEALLKQVRSYGGEDVWKDKERFVKFARASLELSHVYKEIASRRELFAAEMHLKSTIKRGTDFSDTQEYGELVACLEDVQVALANGSVVL